MVQSVGTTFRIGGIVNGKHRCIKAEGSQGTAEVSNRSSVNVSEEEESREARPVEGEAGELGLSGSVVLDVYGGGGSNGDGVVLTEEDKGHEP